MDHYTAKSPVVLRAADVLDNVFRALNGKFKLPENTNIHIRSNNDLHFKDDLDGPRLPDLNFNPVNFQSDETVIMSMAHAMHSLHTIRSRTAERLDLRDDIGIGMDVLTGPAILEGGWLAGQLKMLRRTKRIRPFVIDRDKPYVDIEKVTLRCPNGHPFVVEMTPNVENNVGQTCNICGEKFVRSDRGRQRLPRPERGGTVREVPSRAVPVDDAAIEKALIDLVARTGAITANATQLHRMLDSRFPLRHISQTLSRRGVQRVSVRIQDKIVKCYKLTADTFGSQ